MGSEKFCLRWNDFESNISFAFRELREDKEFFDVTIACEDDQISAHKVILSACSPFFRDILRRNPHQHPLVYLKGLKLLDLQSVMNFIYHGEVSVAQDDLNNFLAVAEDLKIKGLTQGKPANNGPAVKVKPLASKSKPLTNRSALSLTKNWTQSHERTSDENDIEELVPVKSEPRVVSSSRELSHSTPYNYPAEPDNHTVAAVDDGSYADYGNYEQYEQYEDYPIKSLEDTFHGNKDVESLMSKHESGFMCLICQRVCAAKGNMKKHIESIHIQEEPQQCGFCEKKFKNKNSLQNHISLSHRNK